MGFFRRSRSRRGDASAGDVEYLHAWVASRSGVEGFIEPKTTVTDLTVVLVAADGEWTRRPAGTELGES